MSSLLTRLTKQKSALSLATQHRKWVTAHETVLAGVRQSIDDLSRGFRAAWGGEAQLQEYPLIDEDTYLAIRQRQRFSRTWFFRVKLAFPALVVDLIFYFRPNSTEARNIDESLASTVSLHVAKFDMGSARYIPLRNERWSRIKEIVHNGSATGVFKQDVNEECDVSYGEEARVENWFAAIVEDAISNLASINLASLD